jgi:hypothetical protein
MTIASKLGMTDLQFSAPHPIAIFFGTILMGWLPRRSVKRNGAQHAKHETLL